MRALLMTGGGKFLLGVMVLALAGYSAYKLAYPTYSWRQKLTVEVSMGSRSLSASSVTQVKAVFQPQLFFPDAPALKLSLEGEAVVLDIPNRGTLFALLRGPEDGELMKYIAGKTFANRLPDGATQQDWYAAISTLDGSADVPSASYPLLVTFADINDSKTVKRVDPEDLAVDFGPGVSLERIALETTDEELTLGHVQQVLGWLATIGDGMLDGRRISTLTAQNRLANDLSRLDFARD